jgi:hypothetical protein
MHRLLTFILSLYQVADSYVYDINLTTQSLHLAQSAYCMDLNADDPWTCATCDDDSVLEHIVDAGGGRALVGYNKPHDALFVSYRGSTDLINWLDNVQFRLVYPYDTMPEIGVEKGFHKVYSYLREGVFKSLEKASETHGTNSLMLTGHSLGAIATILAFDIHYFHPEYDVQSLVTFGSPRMGNPSFVDAMYHSGIHATRVTHYHDIVPHVPEEVLGYGHIPHEVWYNEDNTKYIVCDDGLDEDDSCSNSCAPIHCTSTSDHGTYIGVNMGSDGDC